MEEVRVCEVCGGALDQQAAERIAKALEVSPFWHEMRKEPELAGLMRERRPDIFAMAIGMEVCTACREKAHREGPQRRRVGQQLGGRLTTFG